MVTLMIRQLEINAPIEDHIKSLIKQGMTNHFIINYIRGIKDILNQSFDYDFVISLINKLRDQ